jgi:hypothetical protein
LANGQGCGRKTRQFKPKGKMMRGVIRWVAVFILVLALAWCGLWWHIQGRLHDMLANNVRLQDTSDGSSAVQYDNISTGMNPLTASATIHNVRWSLMPPGEDTAIGVGFAQARVWIDAFDPLVMHIGMPNRIFVTTPRVALSITFGGIAANAGLNPRALFNRKIYALTGQNLAIQNMNVVAGAANIPLLHIDAINGHEMFNPAAGPNQTAVTGQHSFDGVSLTPVLVVLGHVPFGGKITHAGFNIQLSGPFDWNGLMEQLHNPQISEQAREQLLIATSHRWAERGGNGKSSVTMVLGPTTLSANGAVVFDANAQASGTADITADHLDAFTAAIVNAYPQLQPEITQIEAQLSPYLTATDTGGQVLNMHIVYGKPGVLINGSRVADMPTIDWEALENRPSAPVPQAPGDGSGAATAAP